MTKEKLTNLSFSVILVLIEVPLVLLSGWFLVALVTRKPFDSQGLLLLSFPLTFALVFGILAWRGFASINVVGPALTVPGWRIVAALCVLIGLMAGAVNWVGMLLPFSVAVVCLQADPKVRKFFMSLHPKHKSSLQVFTIAGASVHIHYWSLMGLCLLVAFVVHFDPELIIFSCIGYAVIIGVHEAGHAIAARMNGLKVFEIHFSGKGGLCRLETPRSYIPQVFLHNWCCWV